MQFYIAVAYQEPAHLVPIARAAEAAGFGGIVLSDHLVYPETLRTPYPYTRDGRPRWEPSTPWPDPFVAVGAMAAVTERLHFLISVYVLTLRHPIVAAKSIATASVLSGGRLTVGVGAGWMREEFDALGQAFAGRGRRLEEAVRALQALLRGGKVAHRGEHYSFGPLETSPLPAEPVPIYGGGTSPIALERAATHWDGWASEIQTASELEAIAGELRRHRAAAGRADGSFGICAAVRDCVDPAGYARMASLGVTELVTVPWLFYGDDRQPLDRKLEGIQRFGADVIARLPDGVIG